MFYYLEGDITTIEPNIAVLDVGGVGYCCYTTANTLSYLEIGKRARLYTYCNIKEDTFDIYGFHDISEKKCFELLLSVSGVGPKAALSILSSSSPESLAMAIVSEDDKVLTSAPGVGKRIAQRIILELKDKVAKETAGMKLSGYAVPSGNYAACGNKMNDVTAALTVLGYSNSEISAALREIDIESRTVEDIIKLVLKNTMR